MTRRVYIVRLTAYNPSAFLEIYDHILYQKGATEVYLADGGEHGPEVLVEVEGAAALERIVRFVERLHQDLLLYSAPFPEPE